MNKKILILCNHKVVLYNFKKELVESLRALGYEIYISMPFDDSLDYFKNKLGCRCIETDVNRRGINPFEDFKLMRKYNKMMKKIKPDLVFSLTIKPTIYGGLCSRKNKIKFITNITGIGTAFQKEGLFKKMIVFMYKQALKKCDECFFENSSNEETFINNKIVKKENSTIVKGAGVNINEFPYIKHNFENKIIFSFIGRVMKEKGIEEFLYCANEMKGVKNIEFRVYGFCEDEYIERFKKLDSHIKYYGFVNDMNSVYKETDVVILPSYHEGMSNVLLEAAASGCILITSNIPGCKEAVLDNITGYLVEVKDKENLLEKVKGLLQMKEADLCEMTLRANNHIKNEFNREDVNNVYIKKFNDLLRR